MTTLYPTLCIYTPSSKRSKGLTRSAWDEIWRLPVRGDQSWTKLFATLLTEYFGTLLFALYGGLAGFEPLGAFSNGLALAVLVALGAGASGAKFNPAVSAGLMLSGNLPVLETFLEMGVQILGGFTGSALLVKLVPGKVVGGAACFSVGQGVTRAQAFGFEFFVSFLLVMTVLVVAVENAGSKAFAASAPLSIGLSLFVGANAAAKFTGGSGNPARYLGPIVGIRGCPQGASMASSYLGGNFLASAMAAAVYGARYWVSQSYTQSHCSLNAPSIKAIKEEQEPLIPSFGNRRSVRV